MVKITLYNIGEYKKKQFLYCFVSFFYACCLCIPNILKESKEDIYLEYSVSMLRIIPLRVQAFKRIIPLRVLHKSVSSSNLQRYPFSHTASTVYLNQSMMASPCKTILKIISKYFLCSCV